MYTSVNSHLDSAQLRTLSLSADGYLYALELRVGT